MSCGDGRPPSLGIVACIAPAPGPTNKMPLITTMLRSFRKTVSRGDLQALGGRTCLYLCAFDRDKMLLEHVRDVQHQAQTPSLNILGVRVFFYPSISLYPSSAKTVSGGSTMSAFREAFVQAYADGAEYFHHTFEDVEYTRAGWMRGAKRWLNKSTPHGIGVFFPQVSGGAGRTPTFVSRRHLEIFSTYAPYGLPDNAVGSWLASVYAERSNEVAYNHTLPRRRAHGRQALIECGQSAVARWLRGVQPPPPPADCSRAGADRPLV